MGIEMDEEIKRWTGRRKGGNFGSRTPGIRMIDRLSVSNSHHSDTYFAGIVAL